MDVLKDFHQAAQDQNNYLQSLSKDGRRIVGYFCSYTPEEIIQAAGAHPVRLFGSEGRISKADAHLQSYSCSLVRGALEEALSGRLEFLDGTVFPHTCDSIQRLSDIWRLNTTYNFFADVILPVKLDTASARDYMIDVLRRFRADLETWTGEPISNAALRTAINTYNQIRTQVLKVYDLRSQDPGVIRGRDILAIIKGAMVMDRTTLADRLPGIVRSVAEGALSWPVGDRKRLMIVGGLCDHPDLYDLIEDSGGVVVWDDLCTGSRAFVEPTVENDDPMVELADRYISRAVCPSKHLSNTARGEALVRLAREHRVDGVIFMLIKFCDPHAFDYPYMKAMLDQAGVPNMLYEMEDQTPKGGQLRTRLETFIHMLKDR